jgi:hypothetical protein
MTTKIVEVEVAEKDVQLQLRPEVAEMSQAMERKLREYEANGLDDEEVVDFMDSLVNWCDRLFRKKK